MQIYYFWFFGPEKKPRVQNAGMPSYDGTSTEPQGHCCGEHFTFITIANTAPKARANKYVVGEKKSLQDLIIDGKKAKARAKEPKVYLTKEEKAKRKRQTEREPRSRNKQRKQARADADKSPSGLRESERMRPNRPPIKTLL